MKFTISKESVCGENIFIFKLVKDGVLQICPNNSNYCTSRCPFFQYDGKKTLQLLCRQRSIKIIIEEK